LFSLLNSLTKQTLLANRKSASSISQIVNTRSIITQYEEIT